MESVSDGKLAGARKAIEAYQLAVCYSRPDKVDLLVASRRKRFGAWCRQPRKLRRTSLWPPVAGMVDILAVCWAIGLVNAAEVVC